MLLPAKKALTSGEVKAFQIEERSCLTMQCGFTAK